MKSLIIAKSNLRKNISSTITLCILIAIASFLLYTGSSVLFRLGTFLDEKNSSLNGPAFAASVQKSYEEKIRDIFVHMDGYQEMESEPALLRNGCGFQNKTIGEKKQSMGCLMLNADRERNIAKLEIIDQAAEKKQNSIILPYVLKSTYGYHTGDQIEISYNGQTETYEVYGFAEDVIFSSPNNVSFYKCYLFNSQFNQEYESAREDLQNIFFKVLIKDGYSSSDFDDAFVKEASIKVKEVAGSIMGVNYETMKIGASATMNVIMALLVAFSIVILLIAMVVIRFTIVMHMEENIKNIGSLEAMGFTNRMISHGFILQFSFIAFTSAIFGLIAASLLSGVITDIISTAIGLLWNHTFDYPAAVGSISLIFVLVLMITAHTAGKLKKITPITALRSGIHTHNFKKNYLPLEEGNMPFELQVGLKGMLQNKRQNISMGVISLLLAFVSIFIVTLYYNMAIEQSAFLQLIGMEKAELIVSYDSDDVQEDMEKTREISGVRKVLPLKQDNMTIQFQGKEASTLINICGDFSQLEIQTIYKGRYPTHDNEIALSNVIIRQLGVGIDDVVTIHTDNEKMDYLVVGITEHISQLGRSAELTVDGMKKLNPSYKSDVAYVYLDEDIDISDSMDLITKTFKNQVTIRNLEEEFDTTLKSMDQSVTAICGLFTIICVVIVVLILYFLVKVKILKERTILGIKKSLGFTTNQLIFHNVVSFSPVVATGCITGSILAVFLVNPLCVMMFSVAGLAESHFIILPSVVIATCLFLILLATTTVAFVSFGIRKIIPRDLFM